MPGPSVHVRLTVELAVEAGFTPAEAREIAAADIRVDELWPGNRKWWRHFNPIASAVYGPLELRRAVLAQGAGDRAAALIHLGRSLHSRQDAIGHGRVGLNHIAWNLGVLKRNPDDWDLMPPSVRARIERATRRALAAFVKRTGSGAA